MLTTASLWGLAAWYLQHWGRRQHAQRTAGALVVAGCPVLPDGTPSPALRRRITAAVAAYHDGWAPLLIVSGHQGEAEAGCALASSLGVPESALVAEQHARDTHGNGLRTAALGLTDDVIVVSDAAHLLRCRWAFAPHFRRVQLHHAGGRHLRSTLREVLAVGREILSGGAAGGTRGS